MESCKTIRSIIVIQIYCMIFIGFIISLMSFQYVFTFLIGACTAITNLFVSLFYLRRTFKKMSFNKIKFTSVYLIKIMLGVIGGIISFLILPNGFITYFLGYLSQSIAVFLYGLKLK